MNISPKDEHMTTAKPTDVTVSINGRKFTSLATIDTVEETVTEAYKGITVHQMAPDSDLASLSAKQWVSLINAGVVR